jgi:hypothetical protein
MVGALVATEPLLRLTHDGVRLDVSDASSRRVGERVIRWRIDLERFSPQLWEASPLTHPDRGAKPLGSR